MTARRILVVDDDPEVVSFLCETLTAAGYACDGETVPRRAVERCKATPFSLVLSDVEMPQLRGPALLAELLACKPGLPVVLMTAFGSVELAVSCMKEGAADFVTKPFKTETLLHVIERVLRERALTDEVTRLRRSSAAADSAHGVIARSEAMRRVLELADRAARTETPILLTGESGTGKSLVARFIHEASGRKGAFVELNCASLPASLVESELFGVRRGAFTDAREDTPGLFRAADKGTLFLDEIGELPLESQPKLLSAVETKKIRAVGETRSTPADARLIAATNRSLEEALRAQQFRPDLYYRLNVLRIELPPLRERREDIAPLVDAQLARLGQRLGPERTLLVAPEAYRWLQRQPWPGNVRELLNAVERAAVLSVDTVLEVDAFERTGSQPVASSDVWSTALSQRWPLQRLELEYIQEVLAALGGNKAEAARVLGIDRRTLYARLEEARRGSGS